MIWMSFGRRCWPKGVVIHPERQPLTNSALRVLATGVQKKLKLNAGKEGQWNDEATEALIQILSQGPRKRTKKITTLALEDAGSAAPLAIEDQGEDQDKDEKGKHEKGEAKKGEDGKGEDQDEDEKGEAEKGEDGEGDDQDEDKVSDDTGDSESSSKSSVGGTDTEERDDEEESPNKGVEEKSSEAEKEEGKEAKEKDNEEKGE